MGAHLPPRLSVALDGIRTLVDRGVTILLYHRIAHIRRDPQLLSVTPERFASHVALLRRRGSPLALGELVSLLREGRRLPGRGVVVTFDDGYVDACTEAKPVLERFDVPATCFVSSGQVGSNREFWWDELEQLLLDDDGTQEQADWNVERPGSPTARQSLYQGLCGQLRGMSLDERRQALRGLEERIGRTARTRDTHRPMTESELVGLTQGGLIEVGAHSVNHVLLSRADSRTQRMEITQSKADLERVVGRPVTSFAYPYGGCGDFTADSARIVRDAGFACACANFPGAVWRGADLLQLPRTLVRNWSSDEFERRLSL